MSYYLLGKQYTAIVWSSLPKHSSLCSSVAFHLVPLQQSSSLPHRYISFEWDVDSISLLYVSLEFHLQDINEIIMFTPGIIIPSLLCSLPVLCVFVRRHLRPQVLFLASFPTAFSWESLGTSCYLICSLSCLLLFQVTRFTGLPGCVSPFPY